MKVLYVLLIIFSVLLILCGGLCIEMLVSYDANSKPTSQFFAIASTILELLAITVGLLSIKRNSKISTILLITSLPMLTWSGLIFLSPTHISVDEVFIFWFIYAVGLIILSIIGFKEKLKVKEDEWDESILDDLV